MRSVSKAIYYTKIREDIQEVLTNIGLKSSMYGLHSLRSGGASAAANFGVKDRLIKKHGRWKSENIKDMYISEDLPQVLGISKNLGL